MGIVAKAPWLGPNWRLPAAGDLFARTAGGQELFGAIAPICRAGAGGIHGGRD
jgi:hypothetical protein